METDGKVVSDFDLEKELHDKVEGIVSLVEKQDINDIQILYKHWVENRQKLVDDHIKKATMEKRKKEIADRLIELREKEEKLRFFEQIEKINLGISRRVIRKPIEDKEEEEIFVAPPTASGKRN